MGLLFCAATVFGAQTPLGWGVAPTPEQQAESLRAAIADLIADFGPRYPDGGTYLKELDALKPRPSEGDSGGRAAAAKAFEALQRKALVANPLVGGTPILFVERHQYAPDHHNTGTDFQPGPYIYLLGSHRPGAALKVLDVAHEGGTRTLLATEQGCIRDPDVSFDGSRIVFAMRRDANEAFQIYEIRADGSGLKRLTQSTPDTDVDPAYLPDGRIVFTSTRDMKFCGCNRHVQGNLFTMRSDGGEVLQISRNNLYDSRPSVLPDGRIVYDRWEYVDSMFGPRFGLWTVNPDGTQHALYCGNNDWAPGAIFDAHGIPGSERVVAVFGACHDRPWGAMVILDRRRGLDWMAPVVKSWPPDIRPYVEYPAGHGVGNIDSFKHLPLKYEDPWPLSDSSTGRGAGKYFLCARTLDLQHAWTLDCVSAGVCTNAVRGKERMGLFLVDVFGNEVLLHAEELGCFDPMPLVPRPRPSAIPSRVDYAKTMGTFYVADVYKGFGMERVPRGSVKWLRVIEAPPKRNWTRSMWDRDTNQAPAMNFNCTNNKRILGDAPVEADGSVYCEVPADRFVFFQLLDANKMMVQSMRSGTTLMPGEHAGCVGCHESRLEASLSASASPTAFKRRPVPLQTWYGAPRDFNYLTEVQPVFDAHCVKCHDTGKEAGKKLNLCGDVGLVFNTSYLDLHIKSAMRWYPDPPGAEKRLIKVVHDGPPDVLPPFAWGSHRSRLVDILKAGHRDVKLTDEEMARIITWIDINAPYYGSYHTAYGDNLFGRVPLTFLQLDELSALTDLPYRWDAKTGRGVIREDHLHHDPAVRNTELTGSQVDFTRPENSVCLTRLDPGDPRYARALAIIREGQANLRRQPREDMIGPEPEPVLASDVSHARHDLRQQACEREARKESLAGGN
jgi:hypothetical protein